MKGRAIIKDVLRRTKVRPWDFFGPCREKHVVQARRAAAIEMDKLGFSRAAIGRLIKRDPTTVHYHLERARA